jgi:DNA segregation ATPase FtsK/SpoIIIE, S-DNA-T family
MALLDRFRRTVRETVTRRDEMERDAATRVHRLRAQLDQALREERARSAAAAQTLQATITTRQAEWVARHEARRGRITKALESAQKKRLATIEAEEGRLTFENQRGLLEAERVRDAALAQGKTQHAEFIAALAAENEAVDQLELRGRATLGGFGSLAGLFNNPPPAAGFAANRSAAELLDQLRQQRDAMAQELSRCNALVLPVLFRVFRLWLILPLVLILPVVFVPELRRFDLAAVSGAVWAITGGSFAAIIILYVLGRRLAAPRARAAAIAWHTARQLGDACAQQAEAEFAAATSQIQATFTSTTQELNQRWKQVRNQARDQRSECSTRLNEKTRQLQARNEAQSLGGQQRLETDRLAQTKQAEEQLQRAVQQLEATHNENLARVHAARDEDRRKLEADWQNIVLPALAQLQAAEGAAQELFPDWSAARWEHFQLPEEFHHAARLGALTVDVEKLCEVSLAGKDLPLPANGLVPAPLLLTVPEHASVLFETKNSGHEQVIGALNNLVLRLLTSAPPGRLAFTILDPVGLGQNFAGIMHLADFEERLINSRIWTQPAQIEQRLADLNEHIEKVTQMYLRNEYESLTEYNAQAGRLAEKYQFLVIADFPTNFTEVAVKRLQSIAASGPRCGVHLLIHWDQRKTAPVEFVPEELRKTRFALCPRETVSRWPGRTGRA